MNSEFTNFPTFINNGKAFLGLDGMECNYQSPGQLQLLPGNWQAKRYWLPWDLQKPNLFLKNPNDTRNNMKSQIKNKKNGSISLWQIIPTIKKIISYQILLILSEGENYEQSTQNNDQSTWCPPKEMFFFFSKSVFLGRQTFSWKNFLKRLL